MKRSWKNLSKRMLSMVLAMVMLLGLMSGGLTAMTVHAAGGEVTVHYNNVNNWTSVNGYVWESTGSNSASWPGGPISENADHAGWFDLVVTDTDGAFKCIFNGNGGQTADLSVTHSADQNEFWVENDQVLTEAPESWTSGVQVEAKKVTVHYENTGNWPSVNGYVWESSGSNSAAWPGDALAKNAAHAGWYDLVVTDTDGLFNCIFNGGGAQTADIAVNHADGTAEFWYSGAALSKTAPESWNPQPEEPEATYIIAGVDTLCGSGWNPADTANKMDKIAEGKYQKVYNNVDAGSYEFKITDGTWDNSWGNGSSNYSFTVDALSTVTILFNEATKAIEVKVEAVPSASYYVAGVEALCGSNWSCDDAANKMGLNADGKYQKVYNNVDAGSYEFKITDGTWDNSWGNGSSNYSFTVDALSTVTILFDEATKTIEVKVEAVPSAAYYVAGVEALCGSNWSCDDAANKMGLNADGKYQKVYNNVDAGTYEFKVTDGTWTNSWGNGSSNYSFTVDALSTVTILFNEATKAIEVKVVAVPSAAYYVAGVEALCGSNWSCDDAANKMGLNADGKYQKVYNNVDAGSYEFKVTDGTWTNSWGNGSSNYSFTVDTLSTVTILFNEATKAIEVKVEAVPAATYIIAGSAGLCGTEWDTNNTDNTMVLNSAGVYEKTYNNVPAGTYEFKVTDGSWDNCWGNPDGNNYSIVLDSKSKVTITFNEATKEINATVINLGIVIPEGYTAVIIHFFKPDTWGSNINAYTWNGVDMGGWPGSPIEANAEKAGWYDLVVPQSVPAAFNFIFNDGGNQTGDLHTGEVTGNTELWVMGNDVLTTAPGEWSGDYDYTTIIHFQKPADWSNTINIYTWNGVDMGGWPGAAVEEGGLIPGWYSFSHTKEDDTAFSFIFNDGNGKQTADLTTGTLQVKTELWVVNGEILTEAPGGWVDPSRTVHIPGTFPGPSWDAGSNKMTYDAETGLYVYTFENVPAANYEYKIAINGSWGENYGAGGVKDGSNISVTVPETMDVTIWYNDQTHNSVNSITYIFADIELTGTGIPEGTKMTDAGLTGIYSVTVPMKADTYEDIKIVVKDGAGKEYNFMPFELKEDKDVTFYFDPSTGICYHDGSDVKVGKEAIFFDSQDINFKDPFGAVAVDEDVVFQIRTGEDVSQAVLVVKGVGNFEMTKPEVALYELGTQIWTATASFKNIGEYDYYFVLTNGSDVAVYGDDDGNYGEGEVTDLLNVKPYDLVVYEKDFETPDWMKDAVIYQIFPDRFFDGNESNNQAQTWARGEVDYEYINDWYTLPENPEQESMLSKEEYLTSGAHYGDGQWSNEIYGGDLKGIVEKIDYLKALGVNVIYLNPVFWSISNHRYDAVDYTEIDPILGTLGDFEQLVAVAEANDMHIILDGVFNHVSDDSVYFDRYYKFLPDAAEKFDGKIGAYPYWAYVYDYMAEKGVDQATAEAAAKTYFNKEYGITDFSYTEWFAVSQTTMAGSADNIGLRAGKEVYSYEGWWGYDSMPVIYSTNGSEYQTGNWAEEIISGQNSVNAYWIGKGMDGWRLDVANEVSDETWQNFRDSVKALDSEAVIIGEIWDDATKYLKGDMYDSVMNYLFRNAVTSFAKGADAGETAMALEKVRERYPEEAFYAMMNLVGSHDTSRLLSYLDGIGDDRNQKDFDSAFPTYAKTSAAAKNMQYVVAFLQFTYPGAPTIYYGDEIGMVGSDDPDDRRAFEWGKGNQELVTYYATMAAIREAYPALRTGAIEMLDLENSNLLGFIRSDDANELIVIANNSASAQTIQMAAARSTGLVDLVTGEEFTGTIPARRGVVLVSKDQAKTITVNTEDLADAYDPAYIIPERSEVAPEPDPECVHEHTEIRDAVEATETTEGYTGDTYCTDCGELVEKGETIPVKEHTHNLTRIAPVAATEEEAGNIEYYVCTCGKLFSDAEGENEISEEDTILPKLPHTHKLKKTPAKKATQTAEGNIEYYTCTKCGKIYKDAKATKEIKKADTIIPKIEDNADTADHSDVMEMGMIMALSGAALAAAAFVMLRRKKRA